MEVYRPEHAFTMNLRVLTLFGVWPSSVEHPYLRCIYKIYGFALHLFYIAVLLPSQFISMYIMRDNLKELVDSSFFTLTCVGFASKLVVIILRRKEIEELFQRLHDPIFLPRRKEHFDQLKQSVIIARASSMTFLFLSVGGVIYWIVVPLINNKQKRTLPFVTWYPYNETADPVYACTYISQSFLLIMTAATNSMIDMLITNFYVIMVGQIETLKQDFRELTDFLVIDNINHGAAEPSKTKLANCEEMNFNEKEFMSDLTSLCNTKTISKDLFLQRNIPYKKLFHNNEDSLENILNDRIIKCTMRYKAILKFIHDVTNFFQFGIVAQICLSSIIICTTTYEMTSVSPTSSEFYAYLQYQICMLYQIFIYTWRGNNITLKIMELKTAVAECDWIHIPNTKFRKSLCIIMSPLQIPLIIIVGKFFSLSVNTLFKIIKMSYSFYVLLKQVNAKKEQIK